jgi:Domain of unknown function (DUF2760)
MDDKNQSEPSFFTRLGTAMSCFWRALFNPAFAREAAALLREPQRPAAPVPQPKAPELPPERVHASALHFLAMLQREGRLIDFVQEDVASFSDADVGAAARVVHAGCRKVLSQSLALEPVLKEAEGGNVNVPAGFDAQRIRLTGNVAGQPPFRGALKHHGWVTSAVRFPTVSETLDPRVLAAAEVEIS